jgi:hypothetical protein
MIIKQAFIVIIMLSFTLSSLFYRNNFKHKKLSTFRLFSSVLNVPVEIPVTDKREYAILNLKNKIRVILV